MRRSGLYLIIALVLLGLLVGGTGAQASATGVITGVVTDTHGKPIVGIDVQALDFATFRTARSSVANARTNQEGVYELVVPAGAYLVCINANFYPGSFVPQAFSNVNSWSRISEATPVKVTSGQTVPDVDFELTAGYTVSGKLVDAQGKPFAAGGWIGDPITGVSISGVLGFGSNQTGEFRVNVPPGTYDLSFDGVTVARWIVVSGDVNLGTITYTPVRAIFDPKPREGYTASPFIPSTGITAPFDVAVAPSGNIYVALARRGVLKVTPEGEITMLAKLMAIYALDVDAQGNVYAYQFSSGAIYQITPDGQITTVAKLPITAMLSGLAVAPTGDIYVGYNGFTKDREGPNHIFKVTRDGKVTTVVENVPHNIAALAFDPRGQLFALIRQKVQKVSLDSGTLTPFIEVPGKLPVSDMTLDKDGNIFVSTGGMEERGELYKISPERKVTQLASIPENGLLGITVTPSGEIIGVQKNRGTLLRVLPDGSVENIVPASGLCTPQAIAFSPRGELFISNDEAGRITRATSAGRVSSVVKLNTYAPPWGTIAFERSGAFYYSEGMPGKPSRLVKVSPEGDVSVVSEQFDRPAGLAFDHEGNLFVAEYMTGKIWYVTPEGAIKTFVAGLDYPESIAFGPDGDLFVTVGYQAGDPAMASTIRTGIVKVAPDGTVSAFVDLPNVQYMAVSPSGDLFATAYIYTDLPVGGQVYKIEPDGTVSSFATGFLAPTGLAFDISGDLFVADDANSTITRVTGFPAGRLAGSVKDATTGHGIDDATVSVVSEASLVVGTTVTTEAVGTYSIRVAPGCYTVSASTPGYEEQLQAGVSVVADESKVVDVLLEPLPPVPAPKLTPTPTPAPAPTPTPPGGGLSCACSPGSPTSALGDLVLLLGVVLVCFGLTRFRRR